jgi:hemerythrin superfamily protein
MATLPMGIAQWLCETRRQIHLPGVSEPTFRTTRSPMCHSFPENAMTVATKSTTTKTDAIALLTADHKKVTKLFKDFEKLKEKGSAKDKQALVTEICTELTIHAQIEEEIFYPAVRDAIDDDDMMDEAMVEHAGAKDLIAQLMSMDLSDEFYDAKVTVLGEEIEHHVGEEEGEMFVKAKRAKLDTASLGEEMLERKEELAASIAQQLKSS